MKFNAFLANPLNAPFVNRIWSWGAIDEGRGIVYLRVWLEHIETDETGRTWALVQNPGWRDSNGHRERQRHLQEIQCGLTAYAAGDRPMEVQYDVWIDGQKLPPSNANHPNPSCG